MKASSPILNRACRPYVIALLMIAAIHFSCYNKTRSNADHKTLAKNLYSRQCSFWQSNPDSVLHYALIIDSLAKDLPAPYQAMGLIGQARFHVTKKTNLSQKLYQQVIQMLQNSNADSILARAHNGLGICYLKQSDYSAALEHFFISLRLAEKNNDANAKAGALANIGELYQVKGDVSSAKKYINRAMEESRAQNNMLAYLDAAQTMANIYGMNNQFDSAMAIDRIGIAAADSIGSTKIKSAFYNNLGNCYLYSNRPDSARYYFAQCLAMDSMNGLAHYMVDNYLTLGQLSLKQNLHGEAKRYLQSAIKLSDSINENQFKAQAWKILSTIYKNENNLPLALQAKDSASVVKDRMINEKSENKIAELQELYEAEKKEQTIAMQQLKLSRQQLLLTGSAVLLASLLSSAWLLYRRYKTKKEKELQAAIMQQREKATIDILQAEDQERRRIAAELHDGVGQVMLAAWINLQAIEPQTDSMNDEQKISFSKAVAMVGEGCKEVREVSHALMPGAILSKGLVQAVKDLINQIDEKIITITFDAALNKDPGEVTASLLYRIIQESVNNTLKHASATELNVTIDSTEEGISIQIEDNGVGFNVEKAMENDESPAGLGLQNIKHRVAYLQGSVEWDSSPGNGTVVTIFVPEKIENA